MQYATHVYTRPACPCAGCQEAGQKGFQGVKKFSKKTVRNGNRCREMDPSWHCTPASVTLRCLCECSFDGVLGVRIAGAMFCVSASHGQKESRSSRCDEQDMGWHDWYPCRTIGCEHFHASGMAVCGHAPRGSSFVPQPGGPSGHERPIIVACVQQNKEGKWPC